MLCLHIKRFRWCNSYRSKVDTQVDFPMKSLDMSAFTVRGVNGTKLGASNSHLYDLAAVIVHHGSGYALTSFSMLILLCKVESNLFYILFILIFVITFLFLYIYTFSIFHINLLYTLNIILQNIVFTYKKQNSMDFVSVIITNIVKSYLLIYCITIPVYLF